MSDFSEASRPIMWGISHSWIIYVLFVIALGFFAWGFYGRIKIWRKGRPDDERLKDLGKRFKFLIKEIALQRRVNDNAFPGVFHSFIFYSFLVLILTTAVVMLDYDFGTSLFEGGFYLLLTFAADMAGLLILIGVIMAASRRYILKSKTVTTGLGDTWALVILSLLVVGGFLMEGLRISMEQDPWALYSPVGFLVSHIFTGMVEETGSLTYSILWWSHMALTVIWIASLPYTKFFHILTIPANAYFSKFKPRGELDRIDIEAMISDEDFDEEDFLLGIESTDNLTWKQRLDLDACIGCGRCEEVCPSYVAEMPFSPKEFIQNCRDLLYRTEKQKQNATGAHSLGADVAKVSGQIVGNAFSEDFIWHCRTCMVCTEVCPAYIDHVDTLIEIRRNEVVMQGRLPAEAANTMKMLETQGNPFGPQDERIDWISELDVPVAGPGEEYDILYWVGCCTTFDPTKQKIATDLFELLKRCGMEVAVLGPEEKCCGDPARVIGQEHLFQTIAKEQVEILNSRRFKVLLVSCPHCYNVLKNEYPQFGGNYNVVHHSEFLHEMLWAGSLKPRHGKKRRIVYHDPCYLGRYQSIYESPREVLKSIPGAEVTEMKRHAERSMCCGGGGGHFWMDIKEGKRINNLRIQQAMEVEADTIVTSCAYCLQMLDDSVKMLDRDEKMEIVDIATLVLETL
jgi:Fe-S oxidoreductase/nitrate reductase gamma subunit